MVTASPPSIRRAPDLAGATDAGATGHPFPTRLPVGRGGRSPYQIEGPSAIVRLGMATLRGRLRAVAEAVSGLACCALEGAVATAGGNRRVSPRRHYPRHRPLKAETRVRIPLEPPVPVRNLVGRPRQVKPTPCASVWGQGKRYGGLSSGGREESPTPKLDDCATRLAAWSVPGVRTQPEPPPDGDQAARW